MNDNVYRYKLHTEEFQRIDFGNDILASIPGKSSDRTYMIHKVPKRKCMLSK